MMRLTEILIFVTFGLTVLSCSDRKPESDSPAVNETRAHVRGRTAVVASASLARHRAEELVRTSTEIVTLDTLRQKLKQVEADVQVALLPEEDLTRNETDIDRLFLKSFVRWDKTDWELIRSVLISTNAHQVDKLIGRLDQHRNIPLPLNDAVAVADKLALLADEMTADADFALRVYWVASQYGKKGHDYLRAAEILEQGSKRVYSEFGVSPKPGEIHWFVLLAYMEGGHPDRADDYLQKCVTKYDYSPSEVAKIRYQAAFAYIPSDVSKGDAVKAWLIIFETFDASQAGKDVYANLIQDDRGFEFNPALESCRDALEMWAKKGYDAEKLRQQLSQVVTNNRKKGGSNEN